jgi:hypothetical protein
MMVKHNKGISQEDFVREWFRQNPDRDIPHLESKPLIEHVDRAIRRLSESGELLKISKGVYRLNSAPLVGGTKPGFSDFTCQATLERDSFCCSICGEPAGHRSNLHVIPITPFKLGGLPVLSNSRTVCSFHKVAFSLLDRNGDISSAKVKSIIDRILQGRSGSREDGLVFADNLLHSLETHIGASGVNWKELT